MRVRPARVCALWLSSLALATAPACGGDAPPSGEIDYHVQHYDVQVDLLAQTATVAVIAEVSTGGDCLSIPSRLSPTGARWNGKEPREGAYQNGVVSLCGRGVETGDELRVEVDVDLVEETWGDLQVGYSVTPDIEGAPFQYLVSWVGGCDRFGPCDARPDRFASYRFEVTHAPAETVLCSGTIVREPGLTICETHYRAPTYSAFGLASSPSWTETELGTWGNLDVSFYDMPSSDTASRVQGDVHDQFVEFLEERFGPYPYGDALRLAVGPTVWSGFEHPGNIMLNDDLRNDPIGPGYEDRLTHTINHEIAHMWAGNRTTLASERDFAWKEATVEYLTFVFEDEVLGGTTAETTALAWKAFSRSPQHFLAPSDEVELIDFYGDAYGPGPLIFYRQLEALFDRESVIAAIARVLQAETAISIADIQAALEDEIGVSLESYFTRWARGSGTPIWPVFAITYTQDGSEVALQVEQTEPSTPMGCAFAIELRAADGESAEVWIDRGVDGEMVTSASATVSFDVTSAVLDPHGHCLAYRGSSSASELNSRRNPWLAR